jgi:hypothetical protein
MSLEMRINHLTIYLCMMILTSIQKPWIRHEGTMTNSVLNGIILGMGIAAAFAKTLRISSKTEKHLFMCPLLLFMIMSLVSQTQSFDQRDPAYIHVPYSLVFWS